MKKIIQTFVIIALFLGALTSDAQNNSETSTTNMNLDLLEEMPSLDFFGEHISNDDVSLFAATVDKSINIPTDNFRLEVLNEMPSLDFFTEAKYHITDKEKSNFNISKDIGLVNNDAFYKQLFKEMPSLNF